MQVISNTDTICAVATPPGAGGIGVVRMSGPAAFAILGRIWRGGTPVSRFEPRKLYLGRIGIANHESRVTGHDKVMAVKMPAPKTYTGQDVVELSCHGSQVVLKKILKACIAAGARPAGPGEFTRRAFLAGKMDLAQAEAVCDLINATSERGARVAALQLEGRLSQEIGGISSQLADLRGEVEASIDFPEEGIEVSGGLEGRAAEISGRIKGLLATYETGRLAKDGMRVAIVGRPNSGKSSILNRLVGCERAIVHREPGTTRDVVEESVSLCGTLFRLRDTAGMRGGAAEVEAAGIARARQEIEMADLVIAVFDGSIEFGREDREVLDSITGARSVLVINKSDLPQRIGAGDLGAREVLRISAKTGGGFECLTKALSASASPESGLEEGVAITSERHREALSSARSALAGSLETYRGRGPAECVAQHLKMAHESLGAITGEACTDAILDRIFSTFCIGK